jgi:hypothetical protein
VLLAALALLAASCGNDDSPTEAAFVIETDPEMAAGVTDFSASGEAVEEAMLCADGEAAWVQTLHADTGEPESRANPPRDGEVLWVEMRFTCGDGSGDFVLRADATVDFAELDSVIATGEMSSDHPLSMIEGTGDYADLRVEGTRQFSIATPGQIEDSFYEVYTGTLTRE